MFNDVKLYFREHKDIILTLLFGILVDHFVFNGVFREKLHNLLESMIEKVTKKMEEI